MEAHQTMPQNGFLPHSTDRIKPEKRARQLDWIYDNKETKASTWFYYNVVHNDWCFLNGIKRHINN
jgi:hypothetical protein